MTMGASSRHADHGPSAAHGTGRGAPTSVIVIDDRSSNRGILARLAGELADNVHVQTFASPGAALDAVVHAKPDLIVTDYKMPEMNGGAFVRALRETEHGFDVPVIVVTAYEDVAYRYDALQAGASDFLLTPVDRLEFVQRGRNLLTMRRQQRLLDRRARARERRQRMKARRRERELSVNEAKFRLVVNSLPALIRAVDAAGRVTFANRYHAAIFGRDPDAAAGQPESEILPEDDAARHAAANASVRQTGGHVSFEEVITADGGAPRTFLTSKVPLAVADGAVPDVLTISIDISEQKRAERQAAEAKELAQRANTAKTEFLAKMSHELRTPLNAILGFADVTRQELLGPLGNPKYREYQADIHTSARQLLRLIDDLLDVSKLELGRLATRAEPVAADELAAQEVRAQTGDGHSGAPVALAVDPALVPVTTDPLRLRQILSNLLSNALKYTPAEGRIAVRLGPAQGHETGLRLEIADDGPGMSAAEVETALSRFGRVQHADNAAVEGVGLGLPIAHDLAAALGGRLWVDSTPGRGTTVCVELPELAVGDGTRAAVADDG